LKLHAMQSYPRALLEAPKAHGGLGITPTSVRIQEAKWRLLQDALLSADPQTRLAGEGLLERGARAAGASLMHQGSLVDASSLPEGVTYWVRSLAEFLALNQVHLRANSRFTTSVLDCPIGEFTTLTEDAKIRLTELGVLRVGDVVQASQDPALLEPFRFPPAESSLCGVLLPDTMGLHQPLHYWPGQVWMRAGAQGRWLSADEILGWTADGLTIRRWALQTPPSARLTGRTGFLPSPIACYLTTPTRGGGSDLNVSWAQADGAYHMKALLDRDRPHSLGLQRALLGWHRVRPCRPSEAFSPPRQIWMPAVTTAGLLACDASWVSDPSSLDPSSPTAQGIGVVLMSPSDRQTPTHSLHIRCTSLYNAGRAFTLEAVALVIAGIIAHHVPVTRIVSDCQSALKILRKPLFPGQRLLQLRRAMATRPRPLMEWTQGHPEKRLTPEAYSQADWGNFLADKAADGDVLGVSHHSIDLDTALATCAAHYPGWAACKGLALDILTPAERYLQGIMDSYLVGRQERHTGEGARSREALVFAMGSRGPLTLKQRVATHNLFFGRFDRDRRHRDNSLHQCDCLKGSASLNTWATICTCPAILDIKETLRTALTAACVPDAALSAELMGCLFSSPDIQAWRANWTAHSFKHLKLTKNTLAKLATATGLIIEASLSMHSVATARERKCEASTPAHACSTTSRRSTLLRHSQLGSHQLTDFGFTISRTGTTTSSNSTIWEPP